MLRPVWHQLRLFSHCPEAIQSLGFLPWGNSVLDSQREMRSALQWRKAVVAYLEFMTDDAWRGASDRDDPLRLWYLGGIRTMNGISSGKPKLAQPRLYLLPKLTIEQSQVASLTEWPRALIVDQLMYLNPLLTDRKLLLRLGRAKLARLVYEAWNAQPRKERRA